MRAYVLSRHGAPDILSPTVRPDPEPGPDQLRVRVAAIGINYAEVLSRKGLYGWAPEIPYVLGMEAAGTVEAVGEGVVDREVGERVVVGTRHGAYATHLIVGTGAALPAIDGFSLVENAAFPVNYATAWVGLVEMGRIRAGDRVLVSPAGGGVGTAAVQIAHHVGCTVVAAAGSDAKLERVEELGANVTVNYRRKGWRERLEDAVGPGVDVALEMVGGDVFDAVKGVLAPFGQVVVMGYASLDYDRWNPLSWWRAWRGMPRMSLDEMLRNSHGMASSHLGFLLEDRARMERVWRELVDFVGRHRIRPRVGHVLPFDEAAEAHRLIESRKSFGKVVLRVAPEPAKD